MTTSRPLARLTAALFAGVAATILVTGVALAHPESEGDHPGGCVVTVEPGTVAAGDEFTVSGNFGGASIFIVRGADAAPAEGAVPDATTPAGSSFSVTFTAETADVGELTVWGLIPDSGCGDGDALTVTQRIPDTAMGQSSTPILVASVLILAALALGADRLVAGRR